MKQLIVLLLTSGFIIMYSCSEKRDDTGSSTPKSSYEEPEATTKQKDDSEESPVDDSGCKYDDGTYSASVDYYNPETGYSATYSLDVEVQDCQIVQINFPNDGYLDDDHISYADIDENGEATVIGEEGKTYNITID
jgi:hypothetical protein